MHSRYGILIRKNGSERHEREERLREKQHSGHVHFAGRRGDTPVFIEDNSGMHWYKSQSGGYAIMKAMHGNAA